MISGEEEEEGRQKSSSESPPSTATPSDEEPFLGRNGTRTPEGVLTPPIDNTPLKYNGRLEFYKEGVLCLELSHFDGGEARKWLKTKGKSQPPHVVKVSKEVPVPCSPLPVTINGAPSHDMSDEGSSLSASWSDSPKPRGKSLRKISLPLKRTSIETTFFMKASSCLPKGLFPRKPFSRHSLATATTATQIHPNPTHLCACGEETKRFIRKGTRIPRPIDVIILRLRGDSSNHLPDSRSPQKVGTPNKKRESREREKSVKKRKIGRRGFEKTILSVPQPNQDCTDGKSTPKKKESSGESLLKPIPSTAQPITSRRNSSKDKEEEILSPEEQEEIQKHAMSKAISYTIQSLLGTPPPPTTFTKLIHNSSEPKQPIPPLHLSNLFGKEHDKNSFLRHLLDTSDPIPSTNHLTNSPTHQQQNNQSRTPKNKRKGTKERKARDSDESPESQEVLSQSRTSDRGRQFQLSSDSPRLGSIGNYTQASTQDESPLDYGALLQPQIIPTPSHASFHPHHLPPTPPLSGLRFPEDNDAPIDLSQKQRKFRNTTIDSDPDVPLNLCKKRRDD